jgi:hypothetical protein
VVRKVAIRHRQGSFNGQQCNAKNSARSVTPFGGQWGYFSQPKTAKILQQCANCRHFNKFFQPISCPFFAFYLYE